MPDVSWWASVLGALASLTVLGGAIITFWTEYGRRWFKRQFGIDEVRDRLSNLEDSVEGNTDQMTDLAEDHDGMAVMIIDAFDNHNQFVNIICDELDIPEEERPQLNSRSAREALIGDEPYSGDFTR